MTVEELVDALRREGLPWGKVFIEDEYGHRYEIIDVDEEEAQIIIVSVERI